MERDEAGGEGREDAAIPFSVSACQERVFVRYCQFGCIGLGSRYNVEGSPRQNLEPYPAIRFPSGFHLKLTLHLEILVVFLISLLVFRLVRGSRLGEGGQGYPVRRIRQSDLNRSEQVRVTSFRHGHARAGTHDRSFLIHRYPFDDSQWLSFFPFSDF